VRVGILNYAAAGTLSSDPDLDARPRVPQHVAHD
jgi:hypothetical protein